MKDDNSKLFDVLNLPYDGTSRISGVEVVNGIKYVTIERPSSPHFCPVCLSKMNSKGIYTRTVTHPIFQDTTHMILNIMQRRWKCSNPECNTSVNEAYPFIEPGAQFTNFTFFYVCEALKDLNRSTASIARQFNMSDTQVHDIFTAHVDLKRLPLPEYISVDEVYLNIDSSHRYAFVIMDFITGEIIDIVQNRFSSTLDRYFLSIPLEERKNVKGVISDAYSTYLEFPDRYFPNSKKILDSFHVVKFIIGRINSYINTVLKKYREKDNERLEKKNHDLNMDNKTIRASREVVLLRDYRWVLLKNVDNIEYTDKLRYDSKLRTNVDTRKIENMFFDLDKNFRKIRELKEKYITFNSTDFKNRKEIVETLHDLIKEYKASDLIMFREFGTFLETYKEPIIASFITAAVSRKSAREEEEYYSRLSNGPMEGFNRKPKDFKRNARGFSNFDYTRNRILWATRKNPPYLGIPKSREEVHSQKGKTRGRYKKKT